MNKENVEAMKARVCELIETGKAKGILTYKEIVEILGDVELDSDQFNRILDTLSTLNIEVIKDEPMPEAELSNESEEEEIDISVPEGVLLRSVHLSDSLMALSFRMHEEEIISGQKDDWL